MPPNATALRTSRRLRPRCAGSPPLTSRDSVSGLPLRKVRGPVGSDHRLRYSQRNNAVDRPAASRTADGHPGRCAARRSRSLAAPVRACVINVFCLGRISFSWSRSKTSSRFLICSASALGPVNGHRRSGSNAVAGSGDRGDPHWALPHRGTVTASTGSFHRGSDLPVGGVLRSDPALGVPHYPGSGGAGTGPFLRPTKRTLSNCESYVYGLSR